MDMLLMTPTIPHASMLANPVMVMIAARAVWETFLGIMVTSDAYKLRLHPPLHFTQGVLPAPILVGNPMTDLQHYAFRKRPQWPLAERACEPQKGAAWRRAVRNLPL